MYLVFSPHDLFFLILLEVYGEAGLCICTFGFWICMYICVNILRPVLTSQAELGACYFVSLALYSYFCYLMFDSYSFLSMQVNSFLERCAFISRFLFSLSFKAPSIL